MIFDQYILGTMSIYLTREFETYLRLDILVPDAVLV